MSKKKSPTPTIRSSAVEYLTFVAASGTSDVNAIFADENIWLSQKMLGLLYNVNVRTINEHLQNIFKDKELQEVSVIRNFQITASDGKNYNTKHYNLSAIIAVGYKVNSERAVQFRKWATNIIESFTIKGYAMDDERLKNDGSILISSWKCLKTPKWIEWKTKEKIEEEQRKVRKARMKRRSSKARESKLEKILYRLYVFEVTKRGEIWFWKIS